MGGSYRLSRVTGERGGEKRDGKQPRPSEGEKKRKKRKGEEMLKEEREKAFRTADGVGRQVR